MIKKDFILPCRVSAIVLRTDSAGGVSLEQVFPEGDVSVVFVTGEMVGGKRYDASDPIVRRIETNVELYVSVHGNATIEYVRKSVVENAMASSDKRVIGVVVCKELDSVDKETEMKAICRRRLSMSALRHDVSLADFLAARFLKRVLLPVLLVYLVVLIANFFAHSRFSERLGEVRAASAKESVEAKRRSAITQAQKRLLAEYDAVPDVGMSRLSDVVASLVSEDMRLTSLGINASLVSICGDALSSETIMSFANSLREAVECVAVNVIALEKDRKEDLFRFEIQVAL